MSAQPDESAQDWIEVSVTIETVTETTARHKIDRRDFEEWAGKVEPADLPRRLREYLRAGDEWDLCAEVYSAPTSNHEVVDCKVRSVSLPPNLS